MRHLNSSQKGSFDTLMKGVRNKLAREEESYSSENSSDFQGGSSVQSFIVEWQMQSYETAETNKKSAREIETVIYYH